MFDPKKTLSATLNESLANYKREREEYWERQLEGTFRMSEIMGETEEQAEAALEIHPELQGDLPASLLLKFTDKLAECAVETAEGLLAHDASSRLGVAVAKMFRENGDADPLLRDGIECLLASRYVPQLDSAADRAAQLASYVLSHPPSRKTRRFLSRLSRCYIAGYGAECIILCRSVLETALADRFELSRTAMPGQMRDRLDLAVRLNWISQALRNEAWTVWLRGNKAVHEDPDLVQDAYGTILLTLHVVEALNAPSKSDHATS